MGWNPLKSAFNKVKNFAKDTVSYVKKQASDPMFWLTGGASTHAADNTSPATIIFAFVHFNFLPPSCTFT